MRSLPHSLARAALAHGLEVHNYYSGAAYVEVFIPERVIGCMMRGPSTKVNAFIDQLESGSLGLDESDAIAADLEVHHLGKVPKIGAMTAVCFPGWQFQPEEDA